MNLRALMQNYYEVSQIPLSIVEHSSVEVISPLKFNPNPALFLIKPILQADKPARMNVAITREGVIAGYIIDRKTEALIVIGPVLEYPCTYNIARSILATLGESAETVNTLLSQFEKTPCFGLPKFLRHLLFLNFLINDESPPKNYLSEKANTLISPDIYADTQRLPHSWSEVQVGTQILAYIEHGKVDELRKILQSDRIIGGDTNFAANDALRSMKNIFVITVALASQAAMQGGMSNETAVFVRDRYLQKMERLNSIQEISALWYQVQMDYCTSVWRIRGPQGNSRLAHRTSAYVIDHIFEKLKIKDIANALGYNRSYLCEAFKRETGGNLGEFIQKAKIHEAELLMRTTEKKTAEIAAELGYSSQSHFQTVFKRTLGVTPVQYKAKIV